MLSKSDEEILTERLRNWGGGLLTTSTVPQTGFIA